MQATITEVVVQTGNQLNVSVQYTNEATGFDRTNVFTIPATDIKRLSDVAELEAMIQAQGKEYAEIDAKKDDIISLVGTVFEIK